MSEQVTEIAYIPLVAGVDLSSGDDQKIWDETLKTITSQLGSNSIFWGRQVEHPDVVQLAIGWESYQAHKDFISSSSYAPFLARLKPLLSAAPKIFHVKIPSEKPFSAPTTECLSLYFEPSHSQSDFDNNFAKFQDASSKAADEAQGISGGWGIEESKHAKLGDKEGEEGPAKLFGAFIGWPSVEAHMKFREIEAFPSIAAFLRDGPKALEVHHVHFQKY